MTRHNVPDSVIIQFKDSEGRGIPLAVAGVLMEIIGAALPNSTLADNGDAVMGVRIHWHDIGAYQESHHPS